MTGSCTLLLSTFMLSQPFTTSLWLLMSLRMKACGTRYVYEKLLPPPPQKKNPPFLKKCKLDFWPFDPKLFKWPSPWFHRKSLTTGNTQVKYERLTTYHSKVMANVKTFCRQRNRQDKKVYAPNLSIRGNKIDRKGKMLVNCMNFELKKI